MPNAESGTVMSNEFQIADFQSTLAAIDRDSDVPYAHALESASVLAGLYTPRGEDRQQPHQEDEVYVVVSGAATIEVDGKRSRLGIGDAAFVAARAQHRFLDISSDFAVWAVFPLPSGDGAG